MRKRDEAADIIIKLAGLLTDDERQRILGADKKRAGIPVSIFRSGLSGLEAVTVYLRDIEKMDMAEIAAALNRKPSTLYTTYQNAKRKSSRIDASDFSVTVSVSVFSDRKFSILESLVAQLKEKEGLSLTRIAQVLGKNYNTVKTVYRRYREKRG